MIKYLNDKGQTLVIFIILLPIVCLITFFFIQKLIFINEEVHLKNLGKDSCRYYLESGNKNKMITLLKKNDSKIDNIKINSDDGVVTLEFDKEIDDLFNFFNDNNYMHIKVTCNR